MTAERASAGLLLVYCFFLPFSDAFRLHRWVPIPMAVLILCLVSVATIILYQNRVEYIKGLFPVADLLLLALIFTIGATLIISNSFQTKGVTHFSAYVVIICGYYFFVKFLLAMSLVRTNYLPRMRAIIVVTVALSCIYALIEFADANYLHLGLDRFVLFPEANITYRAEFLLFIRARAFTAESGFFALFLNIFVPMSYVYLRETQRTRMAIAFLALAIPAAVVTFSVAGFTFVTVGILVAVLFYLCDQAVIWLPMHAVLRALAVIAAFLLILYVIPSAFLEPVTAKLTLSDVSSGAPRLRGWLVALQTAATHPLFGTGIGSTSLETGTGVLSLYLTMFKEAGVFALVFIVAFWGAILRRIALLPRQNPYKYAYAISFVAAVCHYAVISDIWYPWIWLLCIFVIADYHYLNTVSEPRVLKAAR